MSQIFNACYKFAYVKPLFQTIQKKKKKDTLIYYLAVCILLSYKPCFGCLLFSVTWALVPLSVQITQLQGAAVAEHCVV